MPSSYLSAWCDPKTPAGQTPYVWLYPRTGGLGKRKAPSNIFTEADLYTIAGQDGERDLRIEHALSGIEQRFAGIRRNVLLKDGQLTVQEQVDLSAFVSALHVRTIRFREHHRKHWQRVVEKGDRLEQSMARKTPDERRRIARMQLPPSGPTMSHEQAKAIADRPLQNLMGPMMLSEMRYLPFMQFQVLTAPPGHLLITSDNPVTWHSPSDGKKPAFYRGPALGDLDIEITLPLTPDRLLLITHAEEGTLDQRPVIYRGMPERAVWHANHGRSLAADATIVANTDEARFDWFT